MKKLAVITFAFLALTMVSGYSAADNSDNDRKEEDLDPKYAIDGSTLTIKAKFLKELSESYDLPPEWPEKILQNKIPILTVNEAVRKLNESDNWMQVGQGRTSIYPSEGIKPTDYPLVIEFEGDVRNFNIRMSRKDKRGISYTFALNQIYKNKEEFILPLREDQVHNKALIQDVTLMDIHGDLIRKENLLKGELGNYAQFFISNSDWDKKIKIKALIELARMDYVLSEGPWSVDEKHYALIKFQLNLVILEAQVLNQ